MTDLAKLRIKQIWGLLVQYANADPNEADGDTSEFLQAFKSLVTQCMNWVGLVGGGSFEPDTFNASGGRTITVVVSEGESDFDLCRDVREGASLESLARRHHGHVRKVLTWLCTHEPRLADRSLEFLQTHERGIEWKIRANKEFDPQSNPFFVLAEAIDYKSIVAPVCKFILDRISRFDARDEELAKAVPLAICKRPGCGKFCLVERAGRKDFCGDNCRASIGQAELSPSTKRRRVQESRERKKRQEQSWLNASKSRGGSMPDRRGRKRQ